MFEDLVFNSLLFNNILTFKIMENQNVKKAIRLEFKNCKGVIVPELSAFPADFQQIQAATLFLGTGNSFTVSVCDYSPIK